MAHLNRRLGAPEQPKSYFGAHDQACMQRALECARMGSKKGEVPVGAVLVLPQKEKKERWFCAHNRCYHDKNPCAHAEMLVIQEAAMALQSERLPQAKLYVTLEPCVMCAGAIRNARIGEVIFALREPQSGAIRSRYALLDEATDCAIRAHEGLMQNESRELLQKFFQKQRQ